MDSDSLLDTVHPVGEEIIPGSAQEKTASHAPPGLMSVDIEGGRWEDFCRVAPFWFTSPNAPSHEDVLGLQALAIFVRTHAMPMSMLFAWTR
jgi:hypothetical protein